LLNSRLLTHVYQHSPFGQLGRVQAQFRIDFLYRLPIRRISFTTPQEERERLVEEGKELAAEAVNQLATNKRMGNGGFVYSFAEFVDSPLGRWLDARLPTRPDGSPDTEHEQSDVVHDLLAHLAGRMIEMHKAKNKEVRGFLDWLAGYTGLPIEEWSLKTHLKSYYEHNWAEMQRILRRNRRRIERVDVEGREAQERIQREYKASMGKLQPLLARIVATDRLIDLIVYRLYGLTKEEVRMVESE